MEHRSGQARESQRQCQQRRDAGCIRSCAMHNRLLGEQRIFGRVAAVRPFIIMKDSPRQEQMNVPVRVRLVAGIGMVGTHMPHKLG